MSKCFLLFAVLIVAAFASKNDFAGLDFVAAAPYTYNHTTGGGAFNDRTIGENADTVESLEGKQFACGDYITFLLQVVMETSVQDAENFLEAEFEFLASPTGQTGVAIGDVVGLSLNKGNVENGNGGSGEGGGVGVFAKDGGYKDPANNAAIQDLGTTLNGALFASGSTLVQRFKVTGLNAGDVIIVRCDVELMCIPDSTPTGNLQAALTDATTNNGAVSGGGQQTVPLKTVSGVREISECLMDGAEITGVEFVADVVITSSHMDNGGAVETEFTYSWQQGAWIIDAISQGTDELHTYDTYCTRLHDGEYLYAQGACGCEETFIGSNQPQFFYDPNGDYYLANPTTEEIDGVSVKHYKRAHTIEIITDLYLRADNGVIVRAKLSDGRVFDFSNVVYGPIDPAVFDTAAFECTCKRKVDIALVLSKSNQVLGSTYTSVGFFGLAFISDFTISASNAQVAVIEYDSTNTVLLAINDGYQPTSVTSVISSLACSGNSKNPCGSTLGNVAGAITGAADHLKTSSRTSAAKVIVLVLNGFGSTDAEINTALSYAAGKGVTVFAIVYGSSKTQSQLLVLAGGDPDKLIYRYDANDLAVVDPIDLTSRVCLASTHPCGDLCCGHCDTTCGTCLPVDHCDVDNDGCSVTTTVVGSCCVQSQSTLPCPVAPGACGTAACVNDECVFTSNCEAPANDNCYDYECVSGTCKKTLSATDNECQVATCVNGDIVMEDASPCGESTDCFTVECVVGTGCVVTPTNAVGCTPTTGCVADEDCTPPSGCYTAQCDVNSGECSFALSCDDSNACTRDSCVDGACVHEESDNCVSTDVCLDSVCDPDTGGCVSTTLSCDDGIACTLDSCDPVEGCVHEPIHTQCTDGDPCLIGSCDVTAGCVFVNKTCEDDGLFCTEELCVPYFGCSNKPIDCSAQANVTGNPDCQKFTCDEDTATCLAEELTCTLATEIIVASALTSGVIVGIALAAVLFFAFAGGSAYAAYTKLGTPKDAVITNNPLYQDTGLSKDNPLRRG